jgi:serine protease Do
VKLWRQGQIIEATPVVREWLTAEQTDRAALARSTSPRKMTMDLGLQLAALSPNVRATNNLSDEIQGVLVTDVRPNSVAGDRGLAEGDIIVKGMADQKDKMILMLVRNDAGLRWVAMPIDPMMQVTSKN